MTVSSCWIPKSKQGELEGLHDVNNITYLLEIVNKNAKVSLFMKHDHTISKARELLQQAK